jgi:hypothetical protein
LLFETHEIKQKNVLRVWSKEKNIGITKSIVTFYFMPDLSNNMVFCEDLQWRLLEFHFPEFDRLFHTGSVLYDIFWFDLKTGAMLRENFRFYLIHLILHLKIFFRGQA